MQQNTSYCNSNYNVYKIRVTIEEIIHEFKGRPRYELSQDLLIKFFSTCLKNDNRNFMLINILCMKSDCLDYVYELSQTFDQQI